jgi:hypothetical protein
VTMRMGKLRGESQFFRPGPPAEIGQASPTVMDFLRRNLEGITGEILDLGGGRGAYSAELGKSGFRMVLAEKDPACIEAAGRNGIPAIDMGRVEWSELEGRFDVVMMIEVLEHIEDWQGFLANAFSCCRKRLLLTVPCNDDFESLFRYNLTYNHIAVSDHLNHFTSAGLDAFMRERGWTFRIAKGDELWPYAMLPMLSAWLGKSLIGKLALLPLRLANKAGLLPRLFPTRMFVRIDK